jgi:hypothetical protein
LQTIKRYQIPDIGRFIIEQIDIHSHASIDFCWDFRHAWLNSAGSFSPRERTSVDNY